MTLTQVWGSLLIFIVCPLLGGLPLISWITYALTGRILRELGSHNVSVWTAFYHGGRLVGILAVLSEASKGIAAVLLARAFFPSDPLWELVALIALVMGCYWMGKGAGISNVVWGIVVHDPITGVLVFLLGGIGLTIFRDRYSGNLLLLVLIFLILALRHFQDTNYIAAAAVLFGLIAWIYHKLPDENDSPTAETKPNSQQVFNFFQAGKGIISLDSILKPNKVGQKAANLSQLKHWGYPVPDGWVLLPGNDPRSIIEFLDPSINQPLAVRSSAVGEDFDRTHYLSVLNVTSREGLQSAIMDCLASYDRSAASPYPQDRKHRQTSMALLIQKQIQGFFSGVAFSRNPVNQLDGAVVIEAFPADATRVVKGRVTPQQYRVYPESMAQENYSATLPVGSLPPPLIQEVALLTREIESLFHGIPQNIEWTYDGEQLWLLQVSPISNLQPIWTRQLLDSVIPGLIKPLSWSLNAPLICGVWANIFGLVLGKGSGYLNFEETATLHYHRAYFNATLLGNIFQRLGLPSESLEFFTLGTKLNKPPFKSTLVNLPGFLRFFCREWNLNSDFARSRKLYFAPVLSDLSQQSLHQLSANSLLERIEMILSVLDSATYYSIFVPLSFALRKRIFHVRETQLDNRNTPQVESVRSLATLTSDIRHLLPVEPESHTSASLFAYISEIPDGESILERFHGWLETYGYLSDAPLDIAVPRWKENPRSVREMFTQFLLHQDRARESQLSRRGVSHGWKRSLLQRRLDLKSEVTKVYFQLLAHLRWSFVALERIWQQEGLLSQPEDIFYLNFSEIRSLIQDGNHRLRANIPRLVEQRRVQLQQSEQIDLVPKVIYGNPVVSNFNSSVNPTGQRLQGIGACAGLVVGRVKVLHSLEEIVGINRQTIAIVPYTDYRWIPLLSGAGGLISEVGGCLSHGAIALREYSIPGVMNIHNATKILQDGQLVRIDGMMGVVEILSPN